MQITLVALVCRAIQCCDNHVLHGDCMRNNNYQESFRLESCILGESIA